MRDAPGRAICRLAPPRSDLHQQKVLLRDVRLGAAAAAAGSLDRQTASPGAAGLGRRGMLRLAPGTPCTPRTPTCPPVACVQWNEGRHDEDGHNGEGKNAGRWARQRRPPSSTHTSPPLCRWTVDHRRPATGSDDSLPPIPSPERAALRIREHAVQVGCYMAWCAHAGQSRRVAGGPTPFFPGLALYVRPE